ncbi:MAG TPA: helix-turn-helix domain-containing protein [Solirubrobacterales bacterium]|nr:helix-turn-helix domain-containing protein [Solirubrobacterales bacterium]
MPSTSDRRRLDSERLMKAMSHPLRAAILRVLNERTASPAELARELDDHLHNVSYHTKRLEQLGCIELVKERQVRGAVEHFYRATTRALVDTDEWESLDPVIKEDLVGQIMQGILDDFIASARAKIVGADKDFALIRTPLVLDEEGLEEAKAIQERAFEELQEAEARSAERLLKAKADGMPVASAQVLFKMPED